DYYCCSSRTRSTFVF
nr:immunoglobulin light chain junction region [Macaca mulatta]MOX37230.1 immunoglobulin light chain junction region [Macaca mulatta]